MSHNRLGIILLAEARFPEALEELRKGGDLDPLRSDPRYGELLKKAGLP